MPHVCRMSAARLPHVCRMFAACLSHVCRMFVITMSLGAPRPSNTVTITLMILAFMAQASFGVCVQELVQFLARDFKLAAMECPRCKQWCCSRKWSRVQWNANEGRGSPIVIDANGWEWNCCKDCCAHDGTYYRPRRPASSQDSIRDPEAARGPSPGARSPTEGEGPQGQQEQQGQQGEGRGHEQAENVRHACVCSRPSRLSRSDGSIWA